MNSKTASSFFRFTAVILTMTALMKLFSAGGTAKVLQVQDQLLHIRYRPLVILVALIELLVSAFLLRSRSDLKRCLVLLWLSGNFLVYHWASYLLGLSTCPCLGHLADRLPLPQGLASMALQILAFFWCLTSLEKLWRLWLSAEWRRLAMAARKSLLESFDRAVENKAR